jgi:hypothetical protein
VSGNLAAVSMSATKRRAPVLNPSLINAHVSANSPAETIPASANQQNSQTTPMTDQTEIVIVLADSNKEIVKNSIKVSDLPVAKY